MPAEFPVHRLPNGPIAIYLVITLFVILSLCTVGFLAYQTLQCKGECTEGSKFCQRQCFKKGHCPFEYKD